MATIVDGTVGITFPAGGVGNPAGAAVGTTDTQTLTNKTLTGAVMNGTLGATTPASVSATTIVASNLLTQAAGANIASAATIDLSTATGNGCRITGTTAISAVTMTTGQQVLIVADGALPLTYNATTNKLNSGAASVTLAAGDMVFYSKDLSGIVHGNIIKADGTAVVAATSSDTGSSSLYGAGTDGNVTISSGTTTLTRDMYYANLTMTGGKINPAGYRIFVNDTFDISGYTTGGPAIERLSGTAAGITVGVGIAGASGGSGGSTSYLTAGGTGTAGAATTNGGAGGASGAGGTGVVFDPGWGGTFYPGNIGGGSGAAGTVTAIPIYRRIPYLTSGPSSFINGGGRGSGGGGGGGGIGNATGKEGTHPVTGPTGGNGGAGGGVLDIVCKTFKTSGSNPAGLITATGGNGSNGVAGSNAGGSPNGISGGSGGGGGGGGGWIFFCYAIHNGTGVSNLIKADGGTGGNGASGGGGAATAGGGGNGGSGGRITLFNLTTNVITETTGSAGSAASGTTGGAGNSFGATV